jgi:hypothetical protein
MMMAPVLDWLRRHGWRSCKRFVDRQRCSRRRLKRQRRSAHHKRGSKDTQQAHDFLSFVVMDEGQTGSPSSGSGRYDTIFASDRRGKLAIVDPRQESAY